MNFIIFDLEWNNAYNYKLKRGMNEIIEIGAVKLDENLDVVDTFKQLIKPQLSRKLGSRFKNLTHITIDEINDNGIPFEKAFDDFAKWCGRGDKLFLSWSTSDLYTLVANFKYFENTVYVDFMTKYADAQKYCMSFIENASAANQISLSHCAEIFGIDTMISLQNIFTPAIFHFLKGLCLSRIISGKRNMRILSLTMLK